EGTKSAAGDTTKRTIECACNPGLLFEALESAVILEFCLGSISTASWHASASRFGPSMIDRITLQSQCRVAVPGQAVESTQVSTVRSALHQNGTCCVLQEPGALESPGGAPTRLIFSIRTPAS